MSYSTGLAKILTNNLTRFATLNAHQLDGHAANLDFWLAESRHCIDVIDRYAKRFATMKAVQLERNPATAKLNVVAPRGSGRSSR